MIQYVIMSFIVGYSGNKLWGKDKRTLECVKMGLVSGSLLSVIYILLR